MSENGTSACAVPRFVASRRKIRLTPPSPRAAIFSLSSARASAALSMNSANSAPRESASSPSAPVPAGRLGGVRWHREKAALHGVLPFQPGPGEIEHCQCRHLRAQLLSQRAGSHLLDFPWGEIAKPERPEGDSDQPIDREPEMTQHVL